MIYKAAAALKLAVVVAGKSSPPAAGTARLKTALDAQGRISLTSGTSSQLVSGDLRQKRKVLTPGANVCRAVARHSRIGIHFAEIQWNEE